MNSFLIAQGFSGLGMATVVIGAILNIILDPLFIFVFHMALPELPLRRSFPRSSPVSLYLAAVQQTDAVRLGWGDFHVSVMKRIVTFGFSPFLILASDSILLIVLNHRAAALRRSG